MSRCQKACVAPEDDSKTGSDTVSNLMPKSISNISNIVTKVINYMTQSSDRTQSRTAWPASQAARCSKTEWGQLLEVRNQQQRCNVVHGQLSSSLLMKGKDKQNHQPSVSLLFGRNK